MTYNWVEMENKVGVTLQEVYEETRSSRKCGQYFAKAAGVYEVGNNTILRELHKRGIKVNNLGGKNYTNRDISKAHLKAILKVKGYEKLTARQIREETGLTHSQFSDCHFKYGFKYRIKRARIDFTELFKKYNCNDKSELAKTLMKKCNNTNKIARVIGCSQFYAWYLCKNAGICFKSASQLNDLRKVRSELGVNEPGRDLVL